MATIESNFTSRFGHRYRLGTHDAVGHITWYAGEIGIPVTYTQRVRLKILEYLTIQDWDLVNSMETRVSGSLCLAG